MGVVPFANTRFDVVAIASSAGGLQALSVILAALPATFPAAVVIVQHLSPNHPSYLADILARSAQMPVKQAKEGEHLHPGQTYVAIPDYHLLVTAEAVFSLPHTAKVRFSRPSADLLFDSVATLYQERAIGVVLTGADGDGTEGVRAIRRCGGATLAQDEATSQNFSMPRSAIATGDVDWICPLEEIAPMLVALVTGKLKHEGSLGKEKGNGRE